MFFKQKLFCMLNICQYMYTIAISNIRILHLPKPIKKPGSKAKITFCINLIGFSTLLGPVRLIGNNTEYQLNILPGFS